MLIPSIDLMGGKIVQLVQGEKKALETDDFESWIAKFSPYPIVQLIDLDAAKGEGLNRQLVAEFCRRLPCQVGGGIRIAEDAREVLSAGAKKVIIGSSLISNGSVDQEFAASLSAQAGNDRLIFAVDARSGRVSIHGWKTITEIEPAAMMQQLEPYCSGFLYTHIETEGLMQGIPFDIIKVLRNSTQRQLIAAGGIRSMDEIERLAAIGVDAVVGMAIYTNLLNV